MSRSTASCATDPSGPGNRLRGDARAIVDAALAAVEPAAALRCHLRLDGQTLHAGRRAYDLTALRRVVVIGAGKAGVPMARAVVELLGERVEAGHVVVPHGQAADIDRIVVHEAGHPIPDAAGVAAGRSILRAVDGCGADTLVVCLISGGGSALLVCPAAGVSLEDLSVTSRALLACGADIVEINTLRKHLSAVKGGRLARAAAPAAVLTLVLSDVVGDPLDAIASGPTAPDPTSFEDCLEIVGRYGLADSLPAAVLERLRAGVEGGVEETPKPGDPLFEHVQHVVVANNDQAVRAAAGEAERLGYRACVLTTMLQGESREVARVLSAIGLEAARSGRPAAPPACIVCGGETTVTLRGAGTGGRNQELALAAAIELDGVDGVLLCSVGTDGIDGPTDAAGAIADGDTVARAAAAGLDARRHLADNDAYPFFEALDDLVVTGATNTNVMDLQLLLVRDRG